MAQKKLIYDLNGKVKESTGNYYDDAGTGNLVLKNVTFNSMSLGLPDGLAFISSSQVSSSGVPRDGQVVAWNNSLNQWQFKNSVVDISGTIASSSWDITGTLGGLEAVKSLSNVKSGSALPVQYGGTGLQTSSYPTGEALLVGNGTNPFSFITASAENTRYVLTSTTNGWSFTADTGSINSTEVIVFTTASIWSKPTGTKAIRVLVQGAGGGGGSGANRTGSVLALGGAGGSAGAFVDSGIFSVDDGFTGTIVTVGSGGVGGNYPTTNSAGGTGSDGGSSSFGILFYANGGKGGLGGNVNLSTISVGGASVTSSRNIYDILVYNQNFILNSSDSGSSNSTTAGVSNIFTTASLYYDTGGGASGGSLSASQTASYNGGNAGANFINSGSSTGDKNGRVAISSSISYSTSVYLASGGGGGASNTGTDNNVQYPGGLGGNGAWGSGGGGGGASTNVTGSLVDTQQGGNGGNGYVAVVSYKY